MIRGILRILVIGALLFGFVLFAGYFIKKTSLKHQLEKQEKETIGSVDKYNPRVKDVQKILEGLRHYAGPIDGKMGDKTRLALRNFQDAKGLHVTGTVGPATLSELSKQEFVIQKAEKQKAVLPTPKEPKQSVKSAKKQDDENSKQNKTEIQDKIMNSRVESAERVREVQLALKKLGFYNGNIDGKLGLQTERAIKDFQVSKNLRADGIVGTKTWEELKKFLLNNQ